MSKLATQTIPTIISFKAITWLTSALLLFCLSVGQSLAIDENELLPADEAFAASIGPGEANEVLLNWDIAEGYYLYRHAFRFATEAAGITLGDAQIPSGKKYEDEFFGEVETYRGALSIRMPFEGEIPDDLTVEVSYQGCADLGICYPPVSKELRVVLAQNDLTSNTVGGIGGALAGLTQGSSGGIGLFDDEALPAEQAFQYEAIGLSGDELLVRMTAAPGYYLYRDQFSFAVLNDGIQINQVELPSGITKHDEHFGDVEVYYDQLEIPVSLQRQTGPAMTIALQGDFQGCKEKGICYPPMSRVVQIDLPAFTAQASSGAVSTNVGEAVNEQDRLASILEGSPLRAMLLFFLAGLLLAFTPCVFPMVPILSGIIAGQGDDITTSRALILSIIYVLAMSLTYAVAGVFAGLSGSNLQAAFQNPWIISSFSLLFVVLSLGMFGLYELQLPASIQGRLSQMSNRQQGGNYIGVAVMGVLSALIVGPCVAPALAAALIYIGQTGDAILGGTALFAMALGMGIPLVIFGVSAGTLLPRAGSWMDVVKYVFGFGMLGLAIWMLERIIPGKVTLVLWSILFISFGIYLLFFQPIRSGWRRLCQLFGLLAILFGGLQAVSFAMGGDDWTRPWRNIGIPALAGSPEAANTRHFKRVKTLAELRAELGHGQPVILDFYADWCVECKRMEKYTFPEAEVQVAMQNAVLIQVDVTKNDADDQALLKAFKLIGPPAILFFDAAGEERRGGRMIGYLDATDFAAHASVWAN